MLEDGYLAVTPEDVQHLLRFGETPRARVDLDVHGAGNGGDGGGSGGCSLGEAGQGVHASREGVKKGKNNC